MNVPIHSRLGVSSFAMVDDADGAMVTCRRWHIDQDGYVWCHGKNEAGKYTTIKMHRLLTNAPSGMDVDHINGNRLDNRRCNLRVCTHAQNMMNMGKVRAGSGFRGVRKMKSRWHARICLGGKETHIGAFSTAEEAWGARRAAELTHRKEFAPVEL